MDRKAMKQQAKTVFRRHYWMFVIVCLFAAFLGAQFTMSMWVETSNSGDATAYSISENGNEATTSETSQATGFAGIIMDLADMNVEQARQDVTSSSSSSTNTDANAVLGHTRGVFASIANALSSGSLLITVINGISSITHSDDLTIMVLITVALLVYALFWLFIQQTYLIVMQRMALEARTYERVPLRRFLYPLQTKRWVNMAGTMLTVNIFLMLWWLTIVGGIIKTYSYFLVPYIVAENPNIKAKDAIALSRLMMYGHKWECFVAQLSFLGWYVLNMATFGLSGIFYSNGYQTAFFAEYYNRLRVEAKQIGIEGTDQLSDDYLYVKPNADLLNHTYSDVAVAIGQVHATNVTKPTGFAGWLSSWFGISWKRNGAVDTWNQHEAALDNVSRAEDIINGLTYPGRLAPARMEFQLSSRTAPYAMRSYTVLNLIMMFFIFSLVGWLWEVTLALITEGAFVNRGTLHGPWLPIYGAGGIIILVVLKRLRSHPLVLFIGTVVLCGCLEYFSSWYLETTHDGQRWWDYTGYFLNLHGRICAEGLLVFGLGGLAITYLFAPALNGLLDRVNRPLLTALAIVLLVVYGFDQVYSMTNPNTGSGITDYQGATTSQVTGKQSDLS